MKQESNIAEDVVDSNVEKLPYTVSVIVPTYREADNLAELFRRLTPISKRFLGFEVLIVDDNSPDSTPEVFKSLDVSSWARLIVRKTNRGLSPSVIDGCRAARFDTIVVMDADLSHPPERIPAMIEKLYEGDTQMVVGSRYCEGGEVDQSWSMFRRLNSFIATLVARPFTNITDPMSGFMALRRQDFLNAAPLNPIGYKIGLEFIVKCHFDRVAEIPIQFEDRHSGKSKLTLKEQLKYLKHIKRLSDYKFGNYSFLVQFSFVGATGLVIDVSLVTLFHLLDFPLWLSFMLAIWIAMSCNFVLNRFITFDHGKAGWWVKEYVQFVGACSLGAVINYMARMGCVSFFPQFAEAPQVPALIGSIFGLGSNFLFSRYVVFGKGIVTAKKK